ncbi:DJ-1/PfpI family protein [Bacillus sp. FJAT-29790]|uniref:DJ-1/PfpI family protein n=1 Tax=Bacillus sp. FJAT-29790 TaxID=1895002 RepID=UPI001C232EC8|nr:DJ-1/PfpI family protein [Bacillus sp. FJAT-29790]MBU8878095.1 DJ-1/PfpI family protein [Bacillus sp. FJAT-29790]
MKRLLLRLVVYLCTFVLIVGVVGWVGYSRSYNDFYGSVYDEPYPSYQKVEIPEHNPKKPTVAVMLGDASTTTEVFDFLIPYELFAMTAEYNVYAVAPDNDLKSLSGGLEVIPHYTFNELDQLLGKSPDIIVIPYIPFVDEKKYQPVREWLQQHSATTLVSICGGAWNLADAGLLKGKTATTHWQAIDGMKKLYPDTSWKGNQRYVDEGNIVTSGGQTGGFDAVLYVIKQKLGDSMAEKVAKEVKYPTYHFVQNPTVDPYSIDLRFATYVLNYAFQWNKTKTGVLLYNGMEEMALSSIFDTYADTGTTKVLTVSNTEQPIITKHHLNLLARYQTSNVPELDRMIITGTEAKSLAKEEVKRLKENGHASELLYMHSDSPDRFVFSAPLEDLAKQEDLMTANHAVKRFEYRADDLILEGSAFPLETYSNMLLVLFFSVLLALFIDKKFIEDKRFNKSKETTSKTI